MPRLAQDPAEHPGHRALAARAGDGHARRAVVHDFGEQRRTRHALDGERRAPRALPACRPRPPSSTRSDRVPRRRRDRPVARGECRGRSSVAARSRCLPWSNARSEPCTSWPHARMRRARGSCPGPRCRRSDSAAPPRRAYRVQVPETLVGACGRRRGRFRRRRLRRRRFGRGRFGRRRRLIGIFPHDDSCAHFRTPLILVEMANAP